MYKLLQEEFEREKTANILTGQIFTNPLLTDIIFDCLPNSSIFSCSRVSILLNNMAKDYLQRRRQYQLECEPYELDSLDECLEFLKTGKVNQVEGLPGIRFYFKDADCKVFSNFTGTISQDRICRAIKDRILRILKFINIKEIIIAYDKTSAEAAESAGKMATLKFMFPLLPREKMEVLRITGMEDIHWEKLVGSLKSNGLENLKIIRTDHAYSEKTPSMTPSEYEEILRTCPALQELRMAVDFRAVGIFKKHGKIFLIKWLRVKTLKLFNRRNENFLALLGNEEISLEMLDICDIRSWKMDRFHCIDQILEHCGKNLREFGLHLSQCKYLPRLELFQAMSSVRKIRVKFPHEEFQRAVRSMMDNNRSWGKNILGSADLQRAFPNARIIPERCSCNDDG